MTSTTHDSHESDHTTTAESSNPREPQGTPVLEVSDLNVSFPSEAGSVAAVRGVSFDLYPGRTLGIVGESGSGKSVTSMSIMGLLPQYAKVTGSVKYAGEELLGKTDKEMSKIRGKGIGMIFQDPLSALTPVFDIGTQLVEAIVTHQKVTKQQAEKQAVELLDLVGISEPQKRIRAFPHEFSGGMRQRVVIAIAIANNPRVLIADEPTTALDVTSQRAIVELILKLVAERGTGLLFITHDLGLVAQTCERVLVMKDGRVVEEAPVDKLLTAPEQPYTRSLIDASTLPDPRPANRSDEVVITATNLTKKFKSTTAVDDISFTVSRGERLGIVGGSGSGKTTTLKLLAGLARPTSGTVSMSESMHMVFQDPMGSLNPRMLVRDIIAETLPIPDNKRIAEVLTEVGLEPDMMTRYPHAFSGGQRQRISLARALAPRPAILLADEPVSALDVSVRKRVLNLLDSLVAEHNLTLVFVSHDIGVVRSVCDTIIVMHDGRIVEKGDTAQVLRAPQNAYTQSLIAAVPQLDRG